MRAPPTASSSACARSPSATRSSAYAGRARGRYQRSAQTWTGTQSRPGEHQPDVDRGEPDEGEHDGERRAGEHRERLDDRLPDDRDVAADAGEQVAAAGALDALGREPQPAVDDALAQVGEHRLADAGDEREARAR